MAQASETQPTQPVGLVRSIGRFDLTAAIVNGVIGSGIFGLPSTVARLTGAWSPLAALFGGLGLLVVMMCFAEVGGRFRDPGGPYLYAREAFGPFVGYQVGWLTFCTRVLSAAANLNVFALYLAQLLPFAATFEGRVVVMVTVTGIMTAINVIGVRQATWVVDFFTLAKLLPLGLLIVLGLPRLRGDVFATQHVAAPDWTGALLLMVFAYGGFESALIPASEARDPKRDTGFALLTALAVIATFYMLLQLVIVGVLPHAAASSAPISAAFGALLGAPGVLIASLAAMVSVCGWTAGSLLQSPRILYSMAERGELPSVLARVHPRYRTPYVSIVVYAVASLGFGLRGSFAWNATIAAIVRLVYYGLTCVALLVLRRTSSEPSGFRVPWVVAPLGAGFCLWLLSTRSLDQGGVLLALVACGFVGFGVARFFRRP
jgi:APA family basic amino acid/polyamine antiporter